MQNRKRLYEVSVIRPIIILSLVLNHAMVKIAAGGLRTSDYVLPEAYQWLNWFNFGFTLEAFTFISGYVFAFQSLSLQRRYTFKTIVEKKFHRLLLPMLVFGIIYYFAFLYDSEAFTLGSFLLTILSGAGHLWFLPMLLWCLLILWLIDNSLSVSWWMLGCLAVISVTPFPTSVPLGFGHVPHYIFYAYCGYMLFANKNLINGGG